MGGENSKNGYKLESGGGGGVVMKSAKLGFANVLPFRAGGVPDFKTCQVEIRRGSLLVKENGKLRKSMKLGEEMAVNGVAPINSLSRYNYTIHLETRGINRINLNRKEKFRSVFFGFQDVDTASDWIEALGKLGVKTITIDPACHPGFFNQPAIYGDYPAKGVPMKFGEVSPVGSAARFPTFPPPSSHEAQSFLSLACKSCGTERVEGFQICVGCGSVKRKECDIYYLRYLMEITEEPKTSSF